MNQKCAEQRVARIKRAATTACVKRVTSTIMKPKAVLVSVYTLFSEKWVKGRVSFGGVKTAAGVWKSGQEGRRRARAVTCFTEQLI